MFKKFYSYKLESVSIDFRNANLIKFYGFYRTNFTNNE